MTVLPVSVGFLLITTLLARSLAATAVRCWPHAGRPPGNRNFFAVLPFALHLPASWETTVVVTVVQSLVQRSEMVLNLWWLPQHMFQSDNTRPDVAR